jgi:chemotaxis protein methyltransferase CheR
MSKRLFMKQTGQAPTRANSATISDAEFGQFKAWIYDVAGISLSEHKKALVMGRLASRVRHYQLESYGDYFRLLTGEKPSVELQIAVDLLTTNQTYFFREPKHFDFLREHILPAHQPSRQMRVWCAASSTGEEPYSIAMLLAAALGEGPWEILASDLSSRVLERARSGHYSLERAQHIPRPHLLNYCLKGVGDQEGTFMIEAKLKNRIQFMQINLNNHLPQIGEFDVIFIRNVLIYFDMETKRQVISRLLPHLRRGGYLIVGHSESLNGINDTVKAVKPSIYFKP